MTLFQHPRRVASLDIHTSTYIHTHMYTYYACMHVHVPTIKEVQEMGLRAGHGAAPCVDKQHNADPRKKGRSDTLRRTHPLVLALLTTRKEQ